MSAPVEYTVNDKGTATVILNRPEKKNALNRQMQEALRDTFEKIKANPDVKRVVLRAADVRKDFCAGVDVQEMAHVMLEADALPKGKRLPFNKEASQPFADMLDAVARCGKPVLAIVNKTAFGAGSTLAALSSYVVAADDTKFCYPEWQMHLKPSISAPYVVARIGPDNAVRLFSSGERFSARQAQELRIVDRVVPASILPDMANALVRKFENGELVAAQWWEKPVPAQVKSADPHQEMAGLVENVQTLYRHHDEKDGPQWLVDATIHEFAESRCSQKAVQAIQDYVNRVRMHNGGAQAQTGASRV